MVADSAPVRGAGNPLFAAEISFYFSSMKTALYERIVFGASAGCVLPAIKSVTIGLLAFSSVWSSAQGLPGLGLEAQEKANIADCTLIFMEPELVRMSGLRRQRGCRGNMVESSF